MAAAGGGDEAHRPGPRRADGGVEWVGRRRRGGAGAAARRSALSIPKKCTWGTALNHWQKIWAAGEGVQAGAVGAGGAEGAAGAVGAPEVRVAATETAAAARAPRRSDGDKRGAKGSPAPLPGEGLSGGGHAWRRFLAASSHNAPQFPLHSTAPITISAPPLILPTVSPHSWFPPLVGGSEQSGQGREGSETSGSCRGLAPPRGFSVLSWHAT